MTTICLFGGMALTVEPVPVRAPDIVAVAGFKGSSIIFFSRARAWIRSEAAAAASKSFGQVMWPCWSIVSTPKVSVSTGGVRTLCGSLYFSSTFPATIDIVFGTMPRR